MAAVTNSPKVDGLEQQEFVLSQLWRSEFPNQPHLGQKPGVGRTVLLLEALGNLFLSSFWWLQAALDLYPHHSEVETFMVTSLSFSVYVISFYLLIRRLRITFRVHPNNAG